METAIQVFSNEEFGDVRTVMINGVIYFVGKDVAEALGYTNPRDALAKHVDDEDKNTVAFRDGIQGNPNMTVINESGLYSLIFSSKLPAAKKFKRWVTAEVLPSIRKTGEYVNPKSNRLNKAREKSRLLRMAMKDIKRLHAELIVMGVSNWAALASAVDAVEKAYELDLQPLKGLPVEGETVKQEDIGLYTTAQLGEKIGVTARTMNEMLSKLSLQFKDGEKWILTEQGQKYAEMCPCTENGNSGYRIEWKESVLDVIAKIKDEKNNVVWVADFSN